MHQLSRLTLYMQAIGGELLRIEVRWLRAAIAIVLKVEIEFAVVAEWTRIDRPALIRLADQRVIVLVFELARWLIAGRYPDTLFV